LKINYQPIGSGGGIRQVLERTVFFGATDQPMTDELLSKAPDWCCTSPPSSAPSCRCTTWKD
jgi:ABC-type phosphate transport system substrate-binding protein